MHDLEIEKYLHDKITFINIIKKINIIKNKQDLFYCINEIADIIQNSKEYSDFISFQKLLHFIVDTINTVNMNKELDINTTTKNLDMFFNEFYRDVIFSVNIYIFFLGEDKYNLLNKKYTNFEIKKIKSINEIYIKHYKTVKKEYKVLFVENIKVLENIKEKHLFDKIYNYENISNELISISKKIYKQNYDYHFLKNELHNAKKEEFNTLIVGNSYPLVGIDKILLKEKAFNLSMHTQDLYYSYKLAKECISVNKSIKKCIIGVGYYLTYHDLSMGNSDYSKNMIRNIYMPILNDSHNSDFVEESNNISIEECCYDIVLAQIFNLQLIQEYLTKIYYNMYSTYFNEEKTRESISVLGKVKLQNISHEEKLLLGKQRASSHNSLIKYTKTNDEFSNILKEFLELLRENNVEPIIVAFPYTKYYSIELSQKYSQGFYDIIERMKKSYRFRLIDFNKFNDFYESDFIDMDHLGERGCIKVTNYLNELVYI